MIRSMGNGHSLLALVRERSGRSIHFDPPSHSSTQNGAIWTMHFEPPSRGHFSTQTGAVWAVHTEPPGHPSTQNGPVWTILFEPAGLGLGLGAAQRRGAGGATGRRRDIGGAHTEHRRGIGGTTAAQYRNANVQMG